VPVLLLPITPIWVLVEDEQYLDTTVVPPVTMDLDGDEQLKTEEEESEVEEDEAEHEVFMSPLSECLELVDCHFDLIETALLPCGALLSLRSTVEVSLLVLRSVRFTEFSSVPLFESGEVVLETLSFLKRVLLMLLETYFVTSELISFSRRNSWSKISATLCLLRGF
jgi:hypothetical protein